MEDAEEVRRHNYHFKIGQLKIGDSLYFENGQSNNEKTQAKIKSLERKHHAEGIKVYNITVSKGHTFFANAILTHNKCIIL